MGMGNMPKNIYHGYFTPNSDLTAITIDAGFMGLDNNGSVVVGIITHDLNYGEAGQYNGRAIVQYVGYYNKNGIHNRYAVVLSDGTNDWFGNGTISVNDGIISITGLVGRFVTGKKYEVIAMC